jgi:hypothetical protein
VAEDLTKLAEHWMSEPEAHDYPAAATYLSLLVSPAAAKRLSKALEKAPLKQYAPKDILRASGLPLLPEDDPEVAADLDKVRKGAKLSPVLLIRGTPLWVADGFHRVCASYHINPKATIPCRIAALD